MSVQYVPAKRPPTPDILGNVLGGKVGPEEVEIESIQTNGGTQMRAGLNAETVGEYMQTLRDSEQAWPFPPVVVFFDGEVHWLGDGFHRVAAARQLGRTGTIPCEVRAGDRRAAVLYAAGANASHGLRRTNADKRRSVETLLRDEEWAAWSDHEIARRCVVDPKTVGNIRKELAASMEIPQMPTERTVSRGGQTYTQNVSNIGTNQPAYAAVWDIEKVVNQTHRQFYREEHEVRTSPQDMRASAKIRAGAFWNQVKAECDAQGLTYRVTDVVQAINNVAAQMEAKANGTNFPAGDPHSHKHVVMAGTDLDPWAVAALTPGSRQLRSEALARAITPWVQEYRDTYGRNWQDLALNGNPAHTNSTFWQDINKECKRRTVTVDDDTLKLAIKQAFAWLLAEEPAKTQAVSAAPAPKAVMSGVTAHTWEGYDDWTADDDAEYAALLPIWEQPAGTFNSINESRRITRWRVAARLASERRDNLAFSLQESARHLVRAERYAATQQAEAAAPVSTPAEPPAVNRSMTPVLLKGILRQWLGARYTEHEDPAWFMYQMLDDWMNQDMLHHLETFKATLQPGWPVEWLDQAIRELHVHFAPDPEEQAAPAEPVVNLDSLEVVDSVTGPTGWTDPEPESDLDCYDEKAATLAARRMNKLHTLQVRFGETIDLLEEFGELTGRNTATLLAGRELAHLIDILDAEMDDLQKGMRGV
jgi:hypothetical protein